MKKLSILLIVICSFICNAIYAEDIPNNEIWYEANAKLSQTTDYKSSGIYTSAFELPIVSHTFANGRGVIKFNEDVKKIGFAAFMNCSELTSITVPNTVVEYGYWILNGCNKIKGIQISKSVKKIDSGAFSGCGGLESIIVESGNPNFDSRNNCNAIIETKSNTLLAGCKNTIIPNSISSLSSECFYGCYDLKNISIPNSVKSIGYNAFYGCTSLPIIENIRYADTNIIEVTDKTLSTYSIREGTRFIGHQAFKDCVNLTDIKIPNSVIRIESGAFEGCSSLPVVNNIRYADKYLVGVTDTKLSSYTIQEGTLVIGSRAFEGCWNMTSVDMPNSVEIIDEQAFYMCHSLTNITFSSSLNTIGADAFDGCNFKSVKIPNTVTIIGSRAFAQCHRLTDVYVPQSVTTIGDGAFSHNESLSNIVVEHNNSTYDSRENCNAIIETATNTIISACKNTTIPTSVTAIGNEAYARCSEITSFNIPDNITIIGNRAFSDCYNLAEVNIPSSVTSLGEGAFFYCSALKDIVIPNSVKGTLDEVFCYCRELQSVTISNSISYISGRAFNDCEKLTDIYSNALVPPTIEDDWAFKNVHSSMKIHVPAVSIDLYEKAPYWKNFEIVPIQNKNSIIVNLPDDATDGLYNNMTLELVDTERNQTFKFVIKDNKTYSFNNLAENTNYNLSLKSKTGISVVENEKIYYSSGNLNIDLPKEKMKQLCVANAKVLTPANEDVTSSCTINWFDIDDNILSEEQSVSEQIVGAKVKLSVVLPKDLGLQYKFPEDKLIDIDDSYNTINIILEEMAVKNISGKVIDDMTKQPLNNVIVTVSQTLNGKYSKLFSTKTDREGSYSLQTFALPSKISFVLPDYITCSIEVIEDTENPNETVLETVKMKEITGTVIVTNFTYEKSISNSEQQKTENYYPDYNNVEYTIFNETTDKPITNFSVQYPKIVLLEDANTGDNLCITAKSRTSSFKDVNVYGVIDENNTLEITIPVVQLGGINAKFEGSNNFENVGILYDSRGQFVRKVLYAKNELSIYNIPDGEYTLISMGNSRLFSTILNETTLANLGITENIDYISNQITINSGEISKITIPFIPEFEESKLYYTGENTSFYINKPTITIGNYLTLCGNLDFKKEYIQNISNIKLLFDLPTSCEFIENSVLVGKRYGNYSIDGNKVIVEVDNLTDIVRLCVIPTKSGVISLSAFVQFSLNGEEITQPIGSVGVTSKGLSITAPSVVANKFVPVSGTAIGNSVVNIYDNDILIGQTNSIANGMWSTVCELSEPYNLSAHNIYAKVITQTGIELASENVLCTYDINASVVSKVHMLYNGQDLIFDFQNSSSYSGYYTFVPSRPEFTFVIDFSDDPTKVNNVVVYVKTSNGSWIPLVASYNESKKVWVANGSFSSQALPVNVSVDYNSTILAQMDRKYIDDSYEKCEEFLQLRNKQEVDSLVAQIDSAIALEDNTTTENLLNSLYKLVTTDIKSTESDVLNMSNDEIDNFINNDYETSMWLNPNKDYSITDDDGSIHRVRQLSYKDLENYLLDNFRCDTITLTDNSSVLCFRDENKTIYVDTLNDLCLLIENTQRLQNKSKGLALQNKKVSLSDFDDFLSSWGTIENIVSSTGREMKDVVESTWRLFDGKLNNSLSALEIVRRNKERWKQGYEVGRSYKQLIEEEKQLEKMTSGFRRSISALGALFKFFDAMAIINDIRKAEESIKEWEQLISTIESLDCPGMKELAQKAHNYAKMVALGYDTNIRTNEAAFIGVSKAVKLKFAKLSTGGAMAIDMAVTDFSIIQGGWNEINDINWKSEIKLQIPTVNCQVPKLAWIINEQNGGSSWGGEQGQPSNNPDQRFGIDPSGFVYEGVFSNRLEGVTATVYFKEIKEDMYGDLHENIVKWDAEEYGQKNPLLTDENGYYRWDVPQGLWQVKFEKEGYETTYSEWLPVPPPQLDVNISMKQNVQPKVKSAYAYDDAVVLEFDKYMLPSTLVDGNIVIISGNKKIDGSILLLNEESKIAGSNEKFASKVRFNASEPFNTEEIKLVVSNNVTSYANIKMQNDFTKILSVQHEIKSIICDSLAEVEYGGTNVLKVNVASNVSAKGKKLRVKNSSSMIMSIENESVAIDDSGVAYITVHGELPGVSTLTYSIDDIDVYATSIVTVYRPEDKIVKLPEANIPSGTKVKFGTCIILSCETEDASIYYTIDGSCPCDDSKRIKYEQPIVIENDVLIKAIALYPNMIDSEVAEFNYIVESNVTIVDKDGNIVHKNLSNGDDLYISDDFKSLCVTEDIENINILYLRKFVTTGIWQSLYVPFEIKVNSELFDAAELVGYTLTNDGESIAFKLLSDETTMYANTPYLIRPKSLEFSLNLYNSYLSKTVENQYVYESDNYEYVVGGNYSPLQNSNIYILNDNGEFIKNNGNEILFGQRYWLSITPTIEDPDLQDVNAIKYVVLEENETTGINQVHPFEQSTAIYNTLGQRIQKPIKGKIYISKGKTYLAK